LLSRRATQIFRCLMSGPISPTILVRTCRTGVYACFWQIYIFCENMHIPRPVRRVRAPIIADMRALIKQQQVYEKAVPSSNTHFGANLGRVFDVIPNGNSKRNTRGRSEPTPNTDENLQIRTCNARVDAFQETHDFPSYRRMRRTS